ncbi:transketolase [Actinomarinicola tropica]|uniref:Transketolase n=1 Tax=Actinomarinicola tropica TaxID=2789776 RepID=A0A5Q2RES8_9ACTN|nr:transketolase [Actinomarinicola tropica]QGG95319.1 transketolase [Actinomarinicola tropica]
MTDVDLEQRAINVVRGLAMDAPHAARSGHQGTAMALAPLAHVLWTRILRYDAADPEWPDRDRLILSAGHASILLYSMLHLTGQGLTLDDLKDFRQWGSRTPGHPERGHETPGVEVTTGPLGQGAGNSVGMAIAERYLRGRFGPDICDHRTFAICGDGDLSEGLSHEAASLAGHLGLDRLVWIYDDNRITIDGPTDLALSDDAAARFRGYGWNVIDLGDAATDLDALETGLRQAIDHEGAPSLVIVRSHVGYPSPNHTDDHEAHGYALKDDEIAATKEILGLPVDEAFHIPDDVLSLYREAGRRGGAAHDEWRSRRDALAPDVRARYEACLAGTVVEGATLDLPSWEPGEKIATRKASERCLQALADAVPGLVAGGADLTSNTGTTFAAEGVQSPAEPGGRQIYFGIREHAMAAAQNGMALHGGVVPVGGTFFVFSDYMRPAVRLAALSGAKSIFVWTHDSVGVGEDGPTHQPVEHLAAVRAIPRLGVIRPADANETAGAWTEAIVADGPTGLVLSRQDLPVLEGTDPDKVRFGAYVLRDPDSAPDLVLVGTGSEVSVCVAAADLLSEDLAVRVVSMPSWDRFAAQDDGYRTSVLPPDVPTLSVEAGTTLGWARWADDAVGIDDFGASAPGALVLERYGMNAENVADRARQLLRSTTSR